MKKLKKSMLAIIIGVCTVVVALSTVLAVVLLRKGDDGNPPPKKPAADAEYQLTPAQLDLVNAVNAKNKAEAEADRKELLVFDESKFVDENGNAIDMENILGVSDYGFIAMTGGTDQEFYFYSDNGTKTLSSMLKESNNREYTIKDMVDNYISYSFVTTDAESANGVAIYHITDDGELTLIYEVLDSDEEFADYKEVQLEVKMAKNVFYFAKYCLNNDETSVYSCYEVYRHSDKLLTEDDRIFSYTENVGGENPKFSIIANKENDFIYLEKGDSIFYLSENGYFEFEQDRTKIYEFNYLKPGLLVNEYDLTENVYTYKFIDAQTLTMKTIAVDDGEEVISINFVDDYYFYIYEKESAESEIGTYSYYNYLGNKIIEYSNARLDDKINGSNGKFIVLYNKIIGTKNNIQAVDYKNLSNDNQYYKVDTTDNFVRDNYFIVSGQGYNICSFNGTVLFEEDFDNIYVKNGSYIGVSGDKYYLLNLEDRIIDEIEYFDKTSSSALINNQQTLFDSGHYVVNDGSAYSIHNFDGTIATIKTSDGLVKLENLSTMQNSDNGCYGLDVSKNGKLLKITNSIIIIKDEAFSANVNRNYADNYGSKKEYSNNGKYYTTYTITVSTKVDYVCTHWRLFCSGCRWTETFTQSVTRYVLYQTEDNLALFDNMHNITDYGVLTLTDTGLGDYIVGNCSINKQSQQVYLYVKFTSVAKVKSILGIKFIDDWSGSYGYSDTVSVVESGEQKLTYDVIYKKWNKAKDEDNNDVYDYEKPGSVVYTPIKTPRWKTGYNSSDSAHEVSVDDQDDILGAHFVGWSTLREDSNLSTSNHSEKNYGVVTSKASSYNKGNYYATTKAADESDSQVAGYDHDWYCYAVYSPNNYTINFDVYGNLPVNTSDRSNIYTMDSNGKGDISWVSDKKQGFSLDSTGNGEIIWQKKNIPYFTYTSSQNHKVTLPTPTLFGFDFVGWSFDNVDKEKFIDENFNVGVFSEKTGNVTDKGLNANYFIYDASKDTVVWSLNYGDKEVYDNLPRTDDNGNTIDKDQVTVYLTALWKPSEFSVIFSYGNASGNEFSAFVQTQVQAVQHLATCPSSGCYLNVSTGSSKTYTSCTTCNASTEGRQIKLSKKTISSTEYVTLTFSDESYTKHYILYDSSHNVNPEINNNGNYYIIYNQNINENDNLFDIIVNGNSLSSDSCPIIDGSITYGSDLDGGNGRYIVSASVLYDANAEIDAMIMGDAVLNQDQKKLLESNSITVAGSSAKLEGWLVQFENPDGTVYAYSMQMGNKGNFSGNNTISTYMKMINNISSTNASYTTKNITIYAMYSTKPYIIDTHSETEYSSSSLEDGKYISKTETNIEGLNSTSINLNNNTLVGANVQIKKNPSKCEYLGTVKFNIVVYNEYISPDNDGNVAQDSNKIYYIFDKIELTNFGVKIWNGKTGSQSAYTYYNATVVLEWNGSSWLVYANIPGIGRVDASTNNQYYSYSGGVYAFGKYSTEKLAPDRDSDADNKYNRIKISNATSTAIEIQVDYLGISGDYVLDGELTHLANRGTFEINNITAEGGHFGFSVNAYVKSNMTDDDDIEILEPTNSSNEDYIITTAATKVHSADGKKVFWINNVKYTLSGSATAGYYQLANSGADCSLTSYKSFLDANRNMYSVSLVYYDGTTFVHYPKQYTTHSGTTAFKDVNNNDMLTNYSNTILYAIRPEQHYIYASLHPTSVTYLNAADNKRYELNSYLSQINIGGSNFNISIDKTIETSGSNYIYSRLYLVSNNKFDPYGTDGADNSAIKLVSNCNKTISYLGETYTIHYGWYYSQGAYVETTTPYKDRSFVLYLTTHATTGEFMYFMYTDIYTAGSKPSDANEYSGTSSIKFSFTEFKNNLSLTINGSTTPDGVNESDYEVDANDKYNTTDNPLLYRYYHASAGTVNDYTSGGLRQIGSPSIKNVNFAGVDTTDANKYMTSANRNWVINPEEFVVFELQPTSGYLINNLIIKLKNQVIVNLKLDNVDGLDTGSGYYTYTHDVGILGNRTAIKYKNIASSKYFDVYNFAAGGGAQLRTGIGYAIATESNWMSGYSDVYFNPIWIMISGAYDEVEIYTTTISYTEFYINDDSNNNIGFNGTVNNGKIVDSDSDECVLDELTKLSIIVGSLNSGVKLGTNSNYDASYIQKIDRSYRIVFLGKAQLFSSGVHIYASDENYSAYFTSAQRYMDYNKESSTIVPTAFERVAELANNVYFGRNNSLDETLYWNVAGGYNTVLQNAAGDYWRSAPSFINRNLTSNDKLVYFYIDNFTTYHGARFDSIHDNSNGELEYANKYFIALTIVKNIVEVNTNTYIYNQTLTNNEQVPVKQMATDGKLPYMFNENTFTTTMQYYKDVANNRNWIKNGDAYYCYQLDYVGMLDGNDYKKQYSWFNDTVLTNIETKYNNTASNSVVEYNQNATPSAKTMSGYGLSFKYYEIPGYYLQYVELITRDYGSIYLPISSLISELTDNGDNTISNEYVVYRADGTTIISGLYYEIDYYSGTNAYFEIRFYQDDADVLAGAKSINLVSNDLIVNFYSYPQSYYMNLYSYDNMSQSTNTLYSSAKVSTTDTIVRTGNQYQVIVYDSLAVIDASLTMQGYTFVGWGSYYTYEFNNALQNYEATRRFANDEETGNAWNSASLWYDVRTLFERTNRSKLLDYKTRSFFAYDFYVKSSQYSTTTGYFITDTGYGNAGFNQENYNFWSVYAQLFLSNIGAYNPAINTDRSIDLYAIWKPNTYMLKFDIDDSSPAAVQDKNGTTLASLKINNIADGRSGVFGKYTLDTNNYLYYNLKDNNVETYYCFVTFDSTNWFIKKAKKQSGLTLNDLYNSYYTASQSFVSELGDGTNELNMVIDRYGYTWLGWFAGKQTNVLQGESAVYDTSKIVFGSKYYYNMTVPVSNQISNNYTYYESEGNVLEVNGKPMLNKSLYTMLYGATQEERCIDEIRSEFVYWGEHKVVKSLIPESGNSRYYVSHYSYHGNNFDGGASANADFYNLTYYKNGDYLNNFTGTTARVYEYNGGSSRIESALTYFDTTMVYEKLAYNGSTLQFTRTANTTMSKQNRILYLTAYWQQNLYEFVIDWQDNNGNEDADGIYTLNQYGSSEAGILQGDGTVAKEEFGKAHFDDFELSQRLNKFTPVRVGYDFIGWTFYYDTSEGAVNDSPSFFNPLGIGIDYQNYLNLNALTNRFGGPNDALYTAGSLLQSGSATKEVLGDSDAGHYVYIFAIWKPQTFTINIDLNIEWEDLENLYDIDSNFVVALYNEAFADDKESYDFEGIRSDFYKLNEKYYTEIIANVNFVITFDELFNTAYCEVSGRRFYLEDLFATSAGYYFLGWLYNANDPNAIMVANSLMSMVSNVSNKATSVNPEGKVFVGATEHAEPRFDIAFYNELYNTNYKSRINVSGNGVFNDGENIVYFKNASTGDNYTKLSTLDKHGQSSNFGFVTINGKNYQIVSEVVQNHDGTETNYYLYFKYLGVKYYVVYYYEKNTVKTPLVNDQSFLYYKQDDDIKYIVRFDTNGRPYFVNTDYDNRTMFISSNEFGNIRIAVFEKASDTANLTGSTNLLTPNDLTGVSYIFKYVSNVTMLEDGTYEKNVSSVQMIFNPKTTRQFTLYAHWQHKNDFEINIVNGNNNGGTSNSNEGLAGLYDIENIVDGHNEGKDEDGDLKAYQHHITEHYGDKVEIAEGDSYSSVINEINAQNIGYEDEKLSLTYNYYDDLNFNIVPFYNGRYLSEMTLKFYSVTEQRLVSSEDIYQMKSRFVYTTYTMVVKFGWNSSKNMIEVTNITFAIGSSPTVLNCGMQTPYDEGEYSRIYGITLSTNPISQLSILDKNSFNNYLMKLYEYSTGAVTGSIDVANNQKDATYGRNDVNKIAFNMVDVMSSIDITCRFSVQTYNVELYHFLDDDDKRDFTLQGSNRYKVGISTGEFESIVETSNKEGQEAFIAGQVATDMKLATISTDCGASTPSDTYRVPYGYYIYGMYFTSSFYPHRPVDTTSYPKTNELESASGIIRNPLYGFEWIYSNGYYTYGSTPNQLLKDGTDMAYAQSSPILGSKNKFAQSVRLDNLTSYAFVGWYEYVVSGSDVYFDQYIQSSEATYINRNIKLYGYYRPVNAPTSIVFYTWDDATKGYKVYDGNKQEYTLNAELVFNPYEADESNQNKISVVEGMNDYVDEFGNVKINAFNNYGVNERKFNSQADLFDGGDFASGNADDEDMLDKILKTYWFYDYYYNILQFTETSTETGSPVTTTYTIKFDVEEYLNSRQSLFYYLLDDSKTDVITTKPDGVTTNEAEVMANRVYVDVFGTNEVGYKIVRDGTEIALEVVEVYEYDFDGAYLYLKLPAFGDELITLFEQGGATNIPNTERYYRLHEISSVSEYISSLVGTKFEIPSESVADSWIFKAQPRYWVEVLGVRYYILPRVDSYASGNGAKTIFDKDGNINVSAPDNPNDITTEIRYSSQFVSINNYYIDYFDKYYKVDYETYTDAYLGEGNVVIRGSEFICPYYDIETNTVTLPAEGDYPERTYYFDVENATLYYNGAPESTTPHYVYSPVNQNYDVNVAYVTDSGSSHWEYTGVTIRKLPSPNIGYWYDGGEKYGFVGYISLTEEDILSMTRRGTDGDASGENSSGEIYESFMRYIDAVYTADRYDDVSDFGNDEARMQAFIDKYDAEGSVSDPLETRLSRAHATYVSRLKLSVGDKVGGYNMTEFLSNLLLAEEYLPEKDGETTVQYVHINVPVTFTNLMYDDQEIFDPRTGKSLTMSISFLKQFSLITQNTVISKNLHAIPIYSPFIMEYTEESFDVSGSTVTLDVDEMHVWHFDVSGSSTTHVYRKKYGDYVNFAVLTYDQYAELKANKMNLADYFTKMIKNGKIKANFVEDNNSIATIDLDGYMSGDYVIVAYYNKTGLSGGSTYVVRVSDNLLHLSIGAAGDVTYELTTMSEYGNVTPAS